MDKDHFNLFGRPEVFLCDEETDEPRLEADWLLMAMKLGQLRRCPVPKAWCLEANCLQVVILQE